MMLCRHQKTNRLVNPSSADGPSFVVIAAIVPWVRWVVTVRKKKPSPPDDVKHHASSSNCWIRIWIRSKRGKIDPSKYKKSVVQENSKDVIYVKLGPRPYTAPYRPPYFSGKTCLPSSRRSGDTTSSAPTTYA
jgi:hypothetical protein